MIPLWCNWIDFNHKHVDREKNKNPMKEGAGTEYFVCL